MVHCLRTTIAALAAFVATMALATAANAPTILIDNFNDGNDDGWLREDFTLGALWGPSIFDASTGAYHLKQSGFVPPNDPNVGTIDSTLAVSENNNFYANGYFRGTVRAAEPGTTCGLIMRADDEGGTDNGFYYSSSFGAFYIEHFDFSQPAPQTILAMTPPGQVPFRPGETWNIEGGAVGHRLTLKAWRVGTPEPKSPQLSVEDPGFGPTGGGTELCVIAFFDSAAVNHPVKVSAAFDNLTFRRP